MCGMALRMSSAVLDDRVFLPVDADDQAGGKWDESGDGGKRSAVPMVGGVGRKICRFAPRRRKPFQRIGDAAEQVFAQAASPSASNA